MTATAIDELNELATETQIKAGVLWGSEDYIVGAVKYTVLTRAAELGVDVFCKYYRNEKAFDVLLKSEQKYILRMYADYDHRWINITGPKTKAETEEAWNKETKNGTEHTGYGQGHYYKVFQADTRMIHD